MYLNSKNYMPVIQMCHKLGFLHKNKQVRLPRDIQIYQQSKKYPKPEQYCTTKFPEKIPQETGLLILSCPPALTTLENN